jgi:hypothetical protein
LFGECLVGAAKPGNDGFNRLIGNGLLNPETLCRQYLPGPAFK